MLLRYNGHLLIPNVRSVSSSRQLLTNCEKCEQLHLNCFNFRLRRPSLVTYQLSDQEHPDLNLIQTGSR